MTIDREKFWSQVGSLEHDPTILPRFQSAWINHSRLSLYIPSSTIISTTTLIYFVHFPRMRALMSILPAEAELARFTYQLPHHWRRRLMALETILARSKDHGIIKIRPAPYSEVSLWHRVMPKVILGVYVHSGHLRNPFTNRYNHKSTRTVLKRLYR